MTASSAARSSVSVSSRWVSSKQASVLEGDAHRVGERLQQAHIGFRERMLDVQVLEADDSGDGIPHDHRHEDERLGLLALENRLLAELDAMRW